MNIQFDNTYANELEGFYSSCQATTAPSPQLIKFNSALAKELGLNVDDLSEDQLIAIFSGNQTPQGAAPLAQAYAGHQFGNFVPQLGDGRALMLGEVVNTHGKRFDIQLKGSGRTPYSRGGDGKSALGPVLREYIMSEAMHALGIPSTRALAAITTGETVIRTEPLPGGVFTRVAASHIRIGTFQFFAAQQDTHKIKQLADYAIARHYPELVDTDNPYLSLLSAVSDAQASLLAKWMCVGFIHGVMNTDNMTISGETIDYGPCAFMDEYDPGTVFSSIDRHGRYAYQNQPSIAQWNLARLAESLLPVLGEDTDKAVEAATEILDDFPNRYTQDWLTGMRCKLGLYTQDEQDLDLVNNLLSSMHQQDVDYTQLFRSLIEVANNKPETANSLFKDAGAFEQWAADWKKRLEKEKDLPECIELMQRSNPIYIPHNHKVEEAIEAGVRDADYSPFETLIETLSTPFQEQPGKEAFSQPAGKEFTNSFQTFCGT